MSAVVQNMTRQLSLRSDAVDFLTVGQHQPVPQCQIRAMLNVAVVQAVARNAGDHCALAACPLCTPTRQLLQIVGSQLFRYLP